MAVKPKHVGAILIATSSTQQARPPTPGASPFAKK